MTRQSGLFAAGQTLAGDFDLSGLLARLDRVGDGVAELVSHPGEVDEQLRAVTSLQEQRLVELAALTSPEARQRVAEREIELVHFGEAVEQECRV